MPVVQLSKRADSDSSSFKSEYIAGSVIAGFIVLGVAIWLIIRFYRTRAAEKREDQRGATFLSVRGIVKEGEPDPNEEKLPSSTLQPTPRNAFTRDKLTPSIVLPDKVLTKPDLRSRDDIIAYHRQSGTFPQPFAPKPFAFALSGGETPRSSVFEGSSSNRSSFFRNSFMSASSGQNRFSVMSTNSSLDTNPTTGTKRKVRQMFTPVLPDELLLTSLGEHLTVVQSFDDGWCVVGREGGFIQSKSLFSKPDAGDDVELGVVPAWVFMKPVKGLKAERPIRSTSLGITVNMEAPGLSSRSDLMSWSNF
ncbi:hypothetical protein BDQ17DRAFT_1436194 [Cyathus striatus]|nr:hypothetical protein BDQ17DRAFT_1436194 [Cyathus striatus]